MVTFFVSRGRLKEMGEGLVVPKLSELLESGFRGRMEVVSEGDVFEVEVDDGKIKAVMSKGDYSESALLRLLLKRKGTYRILSLTKKEIDMDLSLRKSSIIEEGINSAQLQIVDEMLNPFEIKTIGNLKIALMEGTHIIRNCLSIMNIPKDSGKLVYSWRGNLGVIIKKFSKNDFKVRLIMGELLDGKIGVTTLRGLITIALFEGSSMLECGLGVVKLLRRNDECPITVTEFNLFEFSRLLSQTSQEDNV